jgi:hypothetical protein
VGTLGSVKLWKILGLAGLAGVAATGFVVVRHRRAYRDVDTHELRSRLRARLAEADGRAA